MVLLDGHSLTLGDIVAIADDDEAVGVAPEARARVDAARAVVERKADGDEAVYGINTGFGSFADVRIPHDALAALQLNLLRSHAAGVGEPLSARAVRATMALRANVLACGLLRRACQHPRCADRAAQCGVHPVVPSRGSVGASGDLAPLAHLALVLVGEGEAMVGGVRLRRRRGAAGGGARRDRAPAQGRPRAHQRHATVGRRPCPGARGRRAAGARRRRRGRALDRRPARIDASVRPAHPRCATVRRAARLGREHRAAAGGQRDQRVARELRPRAGRVLDALRRAGAWRRARRAAFVHRTVAIEANAATDNPMVFADTGEIVSGGNFHGAPVAVAADLLAIAVAQFATISERRSDRLVNPALSGLPAFLTRDGGLQSGLMMAQVTAAALTSELKVLAHPASVDTIPTSGNKEDHVSMSMAAALKAERAVALARQVVADRTAVRGAGDRPARAAHDVAAAGARA